MAKEIKLTKEGRRELEEELLYLESVKRDEVGERIRVALEFGDISENSEYDDAKNEQGMLEARIAEINQILSNAIMVEVPKRSKKIQTGSTVTLIMNGSAERVFKVVSEVEADPTKGKISDTSPVGKAISGHVKGDVVTSTGPTGREITIEIVKVDNKTDDK